MTILQELAALYDRRATEAGWPRPGFATENVGAVVVLAEDGSVREIRPLMAPGAKGKMQPQRMQVPAFRHSVKIEASPLWDKTAYSLGITKTDNGWGQGRRTLAEHKAFRELHIALLANATDPALVALRRFCETWQPDQFSNFPDAVALVDQNAVFQLGEGELIHNLPAAQRLLIIESEGDSMCLVSGGRGPVARLHTMIKGVKGARPGGASLVSFNRDAYKSHGKEQGDNAPVSEAAEFAYSTALNTLLDKQSANSMPVGNTTLVFWADATEVEDSFNAIFGDANQEAERELRARVTALAEGCSRVDTSLDPTTRLFVLGLAAPTDARITVRYWYPDTLGNFAKTITKFWKECSIKPSPFMKGDVELFPKPKMLLYDLAAQGDGKNIPDGLSGDLMRAILTGRRYPQTLLSTVMTRVRVAGGLIRDDWKNDRLLVRQVRIRDGRRAAMIRAVLMRNHSQEVPMALDDTAGDAAYLLGRLFGAYAYAERSYQDRGAGLRQKYLGAASATPARIFPVLMRGYEHNLAALRKAGGQKAGSGVKADRAVASIIALLPGGGDLPVTLPLEDQGRFFIGFYHQISAFYAKAEDAAEALIDTDAGEDE